MVATRQMPNPRPLEAISEDVAPQLHGSPADIPVPEGKEDVSQPPLLTKDGTSSQEEQALLANHDGRAGQEQQENRNRDDAAGHVDEHLLEMLENQAEHRALGEPSAGNGSQLETDPSQNEQEVRGRVAQERAIALGQLQAESDNNSAPPKASAPRAEPSRPITAIDMLNARRRELNSDAVQSRNAPGGANQQQQRATPAERRQQKPESSKVRKPQKTQPMPRTANRAAMRTAAVGVELADDPEPSRPAELAAIPGAEPTADGTPLASEADVAALQDQSDRRAGEFTATPPANVPGGSQPHETPSGQYQSKLPGPLRIKKNKEKAKQQGPYARPGATSDVATNKAEKPLPDQNRSQNLQQRGTQLDFTKLIGHSRAGLRQDSLQYTSSAPQEVPSSAEGIRILFKARNERGEWEKVVHELVVDPADPSSVERVAKKDARNQKATFYDKDLRIITPAQSFPSGPILQKRSCNRRSIVICLTLSTSYDPRESVNMLTFHK